MSRTVRKVATLTKKSHKNIKDEYKKRSEGMTYEEYLRKIRIQNLESGVDEW